MPPSFANVRFEWETSDARLRRAEPADRRPLEEIVDRVALELRRRLGGPFTIAELIGLWEQGTDWVLEIAVDVAPGRPRVWDGEMAAGAAFWRYAREASDFAGGRLLDVE